MLKGFTRIPSNANERDILSHLLAPNDVAIDVGANIGFYSCLFGRRVGRGGKVIAVEPTPNVYRQLVQNVELNNLEGIVECHPVALSREEGTLKLNNFPDGQEAYNSAGATESFGQTSEGKIVVQTKTLNHLLESLFSNPRFAKARCLVKVDVEGFESSVIEGGIRALEKLQNVSLMVELCGFLATQCGLNVMQTIRSLRSAGYNPYQVTRDSFLVALTKDHEVMLETESLNVFFIRPNVEKTLADLALIKEFHKQDNAPSA